jgi:hypothetical protein
VVASNDVAVHWGIMGPWVTAAAHSPKEPLFRPTTYAEGQDALAARGKLGIAHKPQSIKLQGSGYNPTRRNQAQTCAWDTTACGAHTCLAVGRHRSRKNFIFAQPLAELLDGVVDPSVASRRGYVTTEQQGGTTTGNNHVGEACNGACTPPPATRCSVSSTSSTQQQHPQSRRVDGIETRTTRACLHESSSLGSVGPAVGSGRDVSHTVHFEPVFLSVQAGQALWSPRRSHQHQQHDVGGDRRTRVRCAMSGRTPELTTTANDHVVASLKQRPRCLCYRRWKDAMALVAALTHHLGLVATMAPPQDVSASVPRRRNSFASCPPTCEHAQARASTAMGWSVSYCSHDDAKRGARQT